MSHVFLDRFLQSGDSTINVRSRGRAYSRLLVRILVLAILLGTGLWMRTLQPVQLAAGGAGWWPWTSSTVVTLYFTDGRFLFPVSRRIPATDGVPRAALQALLGGPSEASGLTSPIPPGVQIRSFTLSEGVAQIDLSAAILGEGDETAAAETAIVETMTALPGVSSVALSVEGKALGARATRMPLLYYASANGLAAIPVAASTPRDAIAAYVNGPPDLALTGVPRDVRLLNYEYDRAEGRVSLNFAYTESIRVLAIEKPDIMRSVLLGLIASLTEFPGVRAVQLDFEGQTRLGLGQCSDLLRVPLPRPRLLNDERLLGR